MSLKAYEDALESIRQCRRHLLDARLDAETAAAGLGDAQASRCEELAAKVVSAYEHADRLLFVLETSIHSARAEREWETRHLRNGRKL